MGPGAKVAPAGRQALWFDLVWVCFLYVCLSEVTALSFRIIIGLAAICGHKKILWLIIRRLEKIFLGGGECAKFNKTNYVK